MLKKSIIITLTITAILFLIIYKIGNAQTQTTGYSPALIPPRDRGVGDRVTWYAFKQIGTGGTYVEYYGTATVIGTSTNSTGRIAGTTTLLPRTEYIYNNGSSSINMIFSSVKINNNEIALAGSLTGFINILNGVGTNTTLGNPALIGTVTGLRRIEDVVGGTGIQASTVFDAAGRGTTTVINTGSATAAGWTWTGTASVSQSDAVVNGTITATTYIGNGSQLTGISSIAPVKTLIYVLGGD